MNPFDIRPLLQPSFWWNPYPTPLLPFFENGFWAVYGVALIAAIIVSVLERRAKGVRGKRQLLLRVRRVLTTFGSLGLILSFFAYERAPYLAAHMYTGILWVAVAAWLISIAVWYVRAVPKMREEQEAIKEFEKYLP